MWREHIKKRYFWNAVADDLNQLIGEITAAEEDEISDIFRLEMHLKSKEDLEIFTSKEVKEISTSLAFLIKDTKRHSRTLGRIRKLLENYRKEFKDVDTQ